MVDDKRQPARVTKRSASRSAALAREFCLAQAQKIDRIISVHDAQSRPAETVRFDYDLFIVGRIKKRLINNGIRRADPETLPNISAFQF